jgi:AcrR family transcriptional regulator
MVRKRFHDLETERRETILAAAAAEFADRGYEGASVNRIIGVAGISKGSLYYYFEDKEDLFATVMEYAFTRMLADTGPVDAAGLTTESFWNAFRDLMHRSLDYLEANEWHIHLCRSCHRLRIQAPDSPTAKRVLDMGRQYTRTMLARGQELDVVRTDLPLDLLVDVTLAVDEAAGRWRVENWARQSVTERAEHADAQIDIIHDMLHARNQGWEE